MLYTLFTRVISLATGKVVPGLTRSIERTTNLSIIIICRYSILLKKNQRIIFITNCYSTEILCRRVEIYHQRGNLNLQTEDRQTTRWRKEEGQTTINKTLHRKLTDRATRTPLKTGYELICSWKASGSCSTSDTHRVTLATNPMISHEWRRNREVFTTSGRTYPLSFVDSDNPQWSTKS